MLRPATTSGTTAISIAKIRSLLRRLTLIRTGYLLLAPSPPAGGTAFGGRPLHRLVSGQFAGIFVMAAHRDRHPADRLTAGKAGAVARRQAHLEDTRLVVGMAQFFARARRAIPQIPGIFQVRAIGIARSGRIEQQFVMRSSGETFPIPAQAHLRRSVDMDMADGLRRGA